ncbi:MAG: hypothetical protein RLZZ272_1560 [Actinomycetota bacterium]
MPTDHPIMALADAFVDRSAALSPMEATFIGVEGHDDRWGDLGPDGLAERRAFLEDQRAAIAALPAADGDADAALAMRTLGDLVRDELEAIEHGEPWLDISHLACTVSAMREVLDVQPVESVEEAERAVRRLATLDEAIGGWYALVSEGPDRGHVVAKRQVRSVIEQLRIGVGDDGAFTRRAAAIADAHPGLATEVGTAMERARSACLGVADALERDYLPLALDRDGVGIERYRRAARRFLGTDVDPDEATAWAWGRIRELTERAITVAREVDPDRDLAGVIELLRTDPAYAAPSQEAFRAAMQERESIALAALEGEHFDVPDEIRRIEVNLVAPGAPLAAWYIGPSEDYRRAGSVWWSLGDATSVPLFNEVTTAYHEGFPGHHLQVGLQVTLADRLSRAHRLLVWNPGYGEGWALYAEQVMDELGFLERPEYVLGYLGAQLMRAVRVVVDLGLHLERTIPDDAPFHPGEPWTPELAVEALDVLAFVDRPTAESEVTRYLGWPGQAISYALGQRRIVELREERRRREGADFDLKRFHADVLGSGPVGLDHLRELVLRA